jgi:hypothetical protein
MKKDMVMSQPPIEIEQTRKARPIHATILTSGERILATALLYLGKNRYLLARHFTQTQSLEVVSTYNEFNLSPPWIPVSAYCVAPKLELKQMYDAVSIDPNKKPSKGMPITYAVELVRIAKGKVPAWAFSLFNAQAPGLAKIVKDKNQPQTKTPSERPLLYHKGVLRPPPGRLVHTFGDFMKDIPEHEPRMYAIARYGGITFLAIRQKPTQCVPIEAQCHGSVVVPLVGWKTTNKKQPVGITKPAPVPENYSEDIRNLVFPDIMWMLSGPERGPLTCFRPATEQSQYMKAVDTQKVLPGLPQPELPD